MDEHNAPHQIPLAIVGMACRLPGADDLEQYWRLLIEGRSAVGEMPADRLDQRLYYDPEVGVRNKTYSKLSAVVSSRKFDHARCPIDERLVRSIDNVHLLLCDVACQALRNAGIDPFNVPLRNTGVYIGHAQGSSLAGDFTYHSCIEAAAQFLREVPAFAALPPAEQQAVIDEVVARVRGGVTQRTADARDVASSLVAGVISKAFHLTGPYVAINSACASSLQAMLLGARALQLGRVDMAIVGGASDCKGDTLVLFSHARALSATGTRPFDSEADGIVCGEGYGALVMKTLDRAVADGDRIWAVIRGLGVSSDGRGKSLWAPRKEGQIKAMERAYRGGLEMSDIEYIEAHATATKLGDATELNTLTEILGKQFPPGKRIPITSVKANIGHALEMAGIAGVIKTCLAMREETIPPAINIRQLNPNIDWEHSPVYVPTQAVPWPKRADGKPRRAGVNAFGIGGLNMHVVLDEFVESGRALAAAAPRVKSAADEAIAVIGLGCVLPGASNSAELWKLLADGRDPKVQVPKVRAKSDLAFKGTSDEIPDPGKLIGGFVTDFQYDWKRHKVPPKQVQQADPLQFMLLEAADQAMQDAGYDQRAFNRENAGVVVGTEFGGDFSVQLQVGLRLPELEELIEESLARRGMGNEQARKVGKDYSQALLTRWPALIDETGSFSTSSLASRIGKTWNLMGGAAALDVGEVSGLAALAMSVDMLRAGDCDMMICAAGQKRMAWPFYESLAVRGLLADGSPRSPLDAQANGQVPGEGVVVVLLKRLADAQADGDHIHAVLRNVSAAHDTSSHGALQLAIERSFEHATAKPADVAVLELGNLGDQQATADEIRAAAAGYGAGRRQPLMVSSIVGQFGNMAGASSLLSLLKAVLELSHGHLPPTPGLDAPSAAVAEQARILHAPGRGGAIEATPDGRRLVAVGTCSRGLAYHAVLEYPLAVSPSPAHAAPTVAAAAPQAAAACEPQRSTIEASVATADLEKFLVNFVVEQTGYPPEVVELDADLEADLGIDSIKKAQMFGELQEYFDVTPLAAASATENLTLDDFPTLRHIVSFLAKMPQKSAAQATAQAAAAPAPAPAPAPVATRPQVVSSPPAAPAAVESHSPSASTVDTADLEKFLVNFVVEQTGYPPEVVELDADLEADLGIDSIKKAQMFGELQEYFDVTPLAAASATENLTLDDFPTLRHIVSFLAKMPQKSAAQAPAAAPAIAPATASAQASAAKPQATPVSQPAPAPVARTTAPVADAWQICRFAAADPAALKQSLEEAASDAAAWEQSGRRRFGAADRFRLAIVADGPQTLATRLATALKQMDNPATQTVLEQQGIFYRQARFDTRIVFLFPGQGSQYSGMLRQLVAEVPAAAAEQRSVDAVMTRLGFPTWAQLAWDESSPLGKDVWTTQISMLLADVLMLAALGERGIRPDVVAGHSYGEYAALVASGAWDLEQAARVTRWRCDSIHASPAGLGGMLATTAPPETIEQLIAGVDGPVFVANFNAPDQTVVGGSGAALAQLQHALEEGLFETRMLPVPCPFHTPLMRYAAEQFQKHLVRETFRTPLVETYSVATNDVVRDGRDIGANLVAHLTTPVRYADLIRKLAAQGPTVFVEVGPQQALTRLNRRIMPAADLASIACDNPARPGVEQIVRVQAILECTGALDRQRAERPAPPAPVAVRTVPGQIWHFDATAPRREKMRQSAASGHALASTSKPTAAPAPKPAPKQAPSPAPLATKPPATPAPIAAPVPPPPAQAMMAPNAVAAPTVDTADLEKFLVNFVVEQTGYPPEVVELDADLEADLGIDSIKKAQMFGELQEYFDVTPLAAAPGSENLTLDDFPTLRHIVSFLAKMPQKSAAPAAPQATAAPARAPAPAPAPAPVTTQPQAVSSPPAAPAAVESRAPSASSVDTADLEKFLVNFVVEQTGYPPEVVELDADLEADLGIDSIKKAQMFGELQEYFDVTPLAAASGAESLTLDDFPTLRHIVSFLAKVPAKGTAPDESAAAGAPAPQSLNGAAPAAQDAASTGGITAAAATPFGSAAIEMIHVRGTPYELGHQHGLEKKTEIRRLLRRIADLTDGDWSELPIPGEARTNPEQFFTADQLEELRGMADAVEVPLGNLAALNLAVLGDLAANSAQVAILSTAGAGKNVLHGLVGDLSLPPAVIEMLSPLVAVREPARGWACATVTFAGIVGSLVGLNGNGLAASAGTLTSNGAATNGKARGGSTLRVDGLLARSDALAGATAELRSRRTTFGWTACLSHQVEGRLCVVEHNGDGVTVADAPNPLVATNRSVLHAAKSAGTPASDERYGWLEGRLAPPRSPRDAGELLAALREMPAGGTLRVVAVVDAANGDFLLECGTLGERVHVGALLPAAPAQGEPSAPQVAPPEAEPAHTVADSSDLAVSADDGQSMRFTMRMRPFPWPATPPDQPQWKGAAAVHGNGPLADALARRLASCGATVVRLGDQETVDEALAELDRASQDHKIAHLFLASHRDDSRADRTNPDDWNRLFERRALVPFFVCQRLTQLAADAGRLDEFSVVAAVNLGGDFGFSGNVTSPESGFLTGFIKGLYLECAVVRGFKHLLSKAIDAPADEPVEALADNIVREFALGTNDYEVSFIGGKRYGQIAVPVAAPLEAHGSVRPGGTWVVTGGARGITAECSLQLARRFGLKLHLIGMSPLPAIDPAWRQMDEAALAALRSQVMVEAREVRQKPNDAWARVVKAIEIDRNLRAFTDAGVSCTYHACDVSDREALTRVLQQVRAIDGPIEGILHGAGIEQSCRVEKKTREGVRLTVGAKVVGAYNLMQLTWHDPVKHFIGFGSTSGRLGGNGQTDYTAASDMLCKLVSWYRAERPECHAVGFHWHAWDELGMASRPETAAMLKAHKLTLMPVRVGVRHMLRELYSRPAETEIVITDWEYHQRFYPKNVRELVGHPDLLGLPGQPISVLAPAAEKPAMRAAGNVAQRVVLRTALAPLAEGEAPQALPGAVFLVGDNPDARALAARLTAGGVQVRPLAAGGDPRAACAELDRAWSELPARALILMTPRDADAGNLEDPAGAARRIARGVEVPFWLTRRWFELVSAEPASQPATLVAVISLGGDFGFQNEPVAPESGALGGMLKSIFVEDERHDHTRFRVKLIDAPPGEPPAELAEAVCRELAGRGPEVEVAWTRGRRTTVALVREPAAALEAAEPARGGVWVVTGGGRGITAASALALARRYALKMHLVGKSPGPRADAAWRGASQEQLKEIKARIVREAIAAGRAPGQDWDRVRKDREIQETIDKFRAAGLEATYHACDVSDRAALAAVLDTIRRQDGPIEGIIHGAGDGKSYRFGAAPADSVRRTMAPKIDGTLALLSLTGNDPLRYFVAFGSISGRFGGNGWSDYAAANEMMAKLCGWFRRRRPRCRITCLLWQTWDEIGRATQMESVSINKNSFKMEFIPPAEGVAHLIDELRAGARESEVLISDGYFERAFYPYPFERQDAAARRAPATEPVAHAKDQHSATGPMVDEFQPSPSGGGVGTITFQPTRDPFLIEHRLKNRPFLPAVAALESLVETAQIVLGGQAVRALERVRIVNGLAFPSDNPIGARATVVPVGDKLRCTLTTEVRDRQGRMIDPAKLLVEAFVPMAAVDEPIAAPAATMPPLGWYPFEFADKVLLYHGTPLRCLKGISYHYTGGWGQIVAPSVTELAGERSDRGWALPMAVLDACEVACGSFLFMMFGGAVEVPYEFERLQWSRMPNPGEDCLLCMHFRGREERHSLFDFTLYDEGRQPILQATGYRTVLLAEGGR